MKINHSTKLTGFQNFLIIPVFSDSTKHHELVNDWIKARQKHHFFKLDAKSIHHFHPNPETHIIICSLGKQKEINSATVRNSFALALKSILNKTDQTLSVWLLPELLTYLQALGEGIGLANYHHTKYQTGKQALEMSKKLIKEITFIGKALTEKQKNELENGLKVAEGVNLVRDLVNGPPNLINPEFMANEAVKIAKKNDYKIKVLKNKEIQKLKMNALLGVNRGSEHQAHFVVMEYWPKGSVKQKPLALVGKGVTFDTGGINLKPSDGLDWMKMDMAGAAVVLGVFSLLKDLEVKKPVIAFLPITDNSIDSLSQKPQDIVTTMSGKTVEIGNTDAEGRLILADAITYAQKFYSPAEIVDLATLTGACMVALGDCLAGLFGNDKRMIERMKLSAESSMEEVWHLPIHHKHRDDIKGKFADLNNIGASGRLGGASTAAAFLEAFVEKTPWIHLDIAGVAKPAKVWDTEHEGATGFGVRLLLDYLRK